MSVDTLHLTLMPCSPEHLLSLIHQPERFAELTGFPAADGLRGFFVSGEVPPDWLARLQNSSEPDPWRYGFFVVDRESRSVIGSAGFKGPPDASGIVEIAYGIVPTSEGRGYATEAAAALVAFAFANQHVRLIRAHTLPVSNASTRVLAKCGFGYTGVIIDREDGAVWRWERHREPLNQQQADWVEGSMHLDSDGPVNQGVLEYLCGVGGMGQTPSIQPAAALVGSRAQFGSHPDIIEHLWDLLARHLPVECRALVCGRPVLVAPARGVIFAAAIGTEYGIRLAPREFALARAAGAEVVHYFQTAGVTLDLGTRFGPHWVFGTFDRREPEWCATALAFAEAAV